MSLWLSWKLAGVNRQAFGSLRVGCAAALSYHAAPCTSLRRDAGMQSVAQLRACAPPTIIFIELPRPLPQ